MQLNQIINLLKTSGINSKKKVIDMLENATDRELIELQKDIERIIAKRSVEK